MDDQANDLRQLVKCHTRADAPPCGDRPALMVIAGGKGGVGTTTIAVNLAVAVARAKQRGVLVDADCRGGDASLLCGLEDGYTIADVLSAKCSLVKALQTGPVGVRVLAGVWERGRLSDYPSEAATRLIAQLSGMRQHADLIVVDAGNSPTPMAQRFCQAADAILLVTTPEIASILGAYATLKALVPSAATGKISLLVNLAPAAEVAELVHGRLARACHRFLGLGLGTAGYVAADPRLPGAARLGKPLVVESPRSAAAKQIDRLGRRLMASTVVRAKQPLAGDCPNFRGGEDLCSGTAVLAAKMGLSPSAKLSETASSSSFRTETRCLCAAADECVKYVK